MNTTTVSKRENPLHSLLFNIVIPVMILKNGTKWLNKFFGDYESANSSLGFLDYSSIGFGCALIFPIIYFIFDLFKRKNKNVISIIGFVNILLTGGIGVFGSDLGLSKNWFIMKEGMLPLVIGFSLFLMSIFKKKSFYNIFLNDLMFKKDIIKNSINDDLKPKFEEILKVTGHYFISGFIISSIIQFYLASTIVVSNPGEASFNEEVSTMTWVSYIAVLLPTMIVLGKGFIGLTNGIEKLTGLKKEEFLRT